MRKPFPSDSKLPGDRSQLVVGRDRLRDLVHCAQLQVILQVLADAREIADDRDIQFAQERRTTDAGELQKLRALDRPRGENDLASGSDSLRLAVSLVLDTRCARAIESESRDVCIRLDGQIRSVDRRPEVCDRGAAPPSMAREELVVADAFLSLAVEVVGTRYAECFGAADDRFHELVRLADVRTPQRTGCAVARACAARVVLRLDEVRQHIAPAPAGISERRPAIVVFALAANVDEAVDRARAA